MLADLVKGVHYLGIPAAAPKEAAAWYVQKLGFSCVYEQSVYFPVRLDMLFMRQGNLMLALYRPAPHLCAQIASRTGGVIDHFAIDAPDFADCARGVYSRGASLDPSTPDGCVLYEHIGEKGVRGVNFTGPCGEVVELCHDYNHTYGAEKGLQGWSHLAIKVTDLSASLSFYEKLGFHQTMNGWLDSPDGRISIAFAENNGFVLELICSGGTSQPLGAGHIDHVALCVTDAQRAYFLCRQEGMEIVEPTVQTLPVLAHGIRCFTLRGPDGERVQLGEVIKW